MVAADLSTGNFVDFSSKRSVLLYLHYQSTMDLSPDSSGHTSSHVHDNVC